MHIHTESTEYRVCLSTKYEVLRIPLAYTAYSPYSRTVRISVNSVDSTLNSPYSPYSPYTHGVLRT